MQVTQNASVSVSINRFDTNESITLDPGVATDVDDVTGAYLLGMRCYDNDGNLLSDFSSDVLPELTAEDVATCKNASMSEVLEDIAVAEAAAEASAASSASAFSIAKRKFARITWYKKLWRWIKKHILRMK